MNASDDLPGPVSAADHTRGAHGAPVTDDAAEVGRDSSRMASILSEWYALNPNVRRLWVYGAGETDPDDTRDIHVVAALTPVCDSDDISPIWLARYAGWQRLLQKLIGRRVHLDWFDGDIEVVPCAEGSEHARVCLASIAWRDYGIEVHP